MARRGERGPPPGTPVHRLHLWQVQAVRDALLVASIAALVWVGYALRTVTVPLLVALLLAYLFEPMVERLSSHPRLSRPVVVGGLLATVCIVVAGLVAVVVPIIVTQTAQLVHDYQEGRFRETAVRLQGYLPASLRDEAGVLIDYLPAAPKSVEAAPPADDVAPAAPPPDDAGTLPTPEQRLREVVREEIDRAKVARDEGGSARWFGVARGGARAAAVVLGGIVRLGFLAFLIPFYFFFFSVWYPEVVSFIRGLLPKASRERTLELLRKMDGVVAGFVRGRIVISVIMGVLLSAGWWVCGVPYSLVVGMVVGLFCAVPYLGGIGIPVAVALLGFKQVGMPPEHQMAWWGVVLWPTVWFGFVQIIEGYGLVPLIAGKATNLDPVTLLVAVLAGGSIMGIYGMLLAIPVAACVKIICTDVMLPQLRR